MVGSALLLSETLCPVGTPPHPDPVTLGELGASPPVDRPLSSRTTAGVIIALLSGLFFACAGVLRQLGMDVFPSVLVGSTIGTGTALLFTVGNLLRTHQAGGLRHVPRARAVAFATSGLASSAGMVAFLLALRLNGTVAVSTALKNISPLFTFFLVTLFMARHEKVSVKLGLLVALVVAGAALTTLGRT